MAVKKRGGKADIGAQRERLVTFPSKLYKIIQEMAKQKSIDRQVVREAI